MNVIVKAMSDHHESSENYCCIVAQSGNHQIILCNAGIKWIIQRRGNGAGGRWTAEGYVSICIGLERLQHGLDKGLRAAIVKLPFCDKEVSP